MSSYIVQVLTGLAGASSLFLVAAGLTVVFGVTRVANFSHGSLYMLGAYVGWSILTRLPREPGFFVLGVLLAALTLAGLGILFERGLLARIYRAPELLQLLFTFGVALVVQDGVLWLWGPADLPLPRPPWLRQFVIVGGERMPLYDLILIAVGPLVLLGLWLLFTRTRWGTLVRAATQDRDMVAALGVDQRWLFTSVFALGAGLAGLGGALSLPDGSANLGMDLGVITDAFVVVVVGGLGSVAGAYLASVLIGVLQAIGILVLPQATLVMVFAIMAVVLVLRPHGLLGREVAAARLEVFAPVRPPERALVWLGAAALAAAVLAPLWAGPFVLSVLTETMVAVLFAASLHFMMGPGGMASFGHAAWFGIGAYAAAWTVKGLGVGMAPGLVLAPLLAGAAAAALGWFVVRLSGVYLAMLTLAFAQIIWAALVQAVDITGGDNGVLGVWPAAWAADPRVYYLLALVLGIGGALWLRQVLYAPFGYALRAARDSEVRAGAIGLHAGWLRLTAFALAGAAAGLAGGVSAFSRGSVFPTFVSISRSVDALLMVLLGGVQSMAGPMVGAAAYTGLFDLLLLATDRWRAVLGVAIILLVLLFPQGIAGSVAQRWHGEQAA
jgi:branched-chain amino acid transport system permease protein